MSESIKATGARHGRFPPTGSGQRGQSAVEFALILPIFLAMALGLIDFGRAYFENHVLLNAAAEGARVGSLPRGGEAEVITAANEVLDSGGVDGATILADNVGSAARVGSTSEVTVSVPFHTLTGSFVPGWTGTITLSQTVRMRHE